MALSKRAIGAGAHFAKSGAFGASSTWLNSRFQYRHSSQLSKPSENRAFLVNTLAMVRKMEAEGVPTNQAEAITFGITDSIETMAHYCVSKNEVKQEASLSKFRTEVDANLAKFKTEVDANLSKYKAGEEADLSKFKTEVETNLSKLRAELKSSLEHNLSLFQHEAAKQNNDLEKIRNELKYELDKLTAGVRLDLNLEKGRNRDELANQIGEITAVTNKLERELHSIRAQVEAAKYDVIKYCIGTLVSISAVGLAVIRILM